MNQNRPPKIHEKIPKTWCGLKYIFRETFKGLEILYIIIIEGISGLFCMLS